MSQMHCFHGWLFYPEKPRTIFLNFRHKFCYVVCWDHSTEIILVFLCCLWDNSIEIILVLSVNFNQKVPVETILLSCLTKVYHVLLTNFPLEVILTYGIYSQNVEVFKVYYAAIILYYGQILQAV